MFFVAGELLQDKVGSVSFINVYCDLCSLRRSEEPELGTKRGARVGTIVQSPLFHLVSLSSKVAHVVLVSLLLFAHRSEHAALLSLVASARRCIYGSAGDIGA